MLPVQPASQTTAQPWLIPLIAAAVLLIFFSGYARMFNGTFRGNDDALYFYQMAVEFFHPGQSAPLHEDVLRYLGQQENSELALQRWVMRVAYANNYVMMNTLIYGSSRLIKEVLGGSSIDYSLFMALSIALGVILCALVAVIALRLVLLTGRDPSAASGVALGLAVVALFTLVPLPPSDNPFRHSLAELAQGVPPVPGYSFSLAGFWVAAKFFVQLFFAGGSEYSVFGYTPRSQVFLVAVGVFLLRWRGAYAAGYGLTLALALVHQSMAGLLLVLLIAIDIVARPKIFDWKVIGLVVAGLAIMVGRDSLLLDFGRWPVIVALGVAGVVIAAVSAAQRVATRIPALEAFDRLALAPIRARVDRLGPIGSDLVLGVTYCLATVPLIIVANHYADWFSAAFLWSDLFPRTLMLLQPTIFVGLAILGIRWLLSRSIGDSTYWHVGLVAVSLFAMVPIVAQAIPPSGVGRAAHMLARYNPLIGWPLPKLAIETREAALHYAIAIELETGRKVLRTMLSQ